MTQSLEALGGSYSDHRDGQRHEPTGHEPTGHEPTGHDPTGHEPGGTAAVYTLAPKQAVPPPRSRDLPNLHASSLGVIMVDGAVAVLASLLCSVAYQFAVYGTPGDLLLPTGTGVIVGTAFAIFVRMRERSKLFTVSTGFERATTAMLMWVCSFGVLLFFLFLFKQTDQISRGATILYFFFGGALVVLSRVYTPRAFDPASGSKDREIVFIGSASDPNLEALGQELGRRLCSKAVVIGIDGNCAESQWAFERERLQIRVRGLCRHQHVDQICVQDGHMAQERLASVLADLKVVPKAVVLLPDGFFASYLRNPVVYLGSRLGFEIQKNPLSRPQRIVKRTTDIVLSALLIVALMPLFLLVAALIKIDSKGPVLFWQKRKGLGGDPFSMLKFRTMSVMENGQDVIQADKDDPRVTRIGKWLRRASIDELPQLWNVLKGEMSLVGPRPHAVAHDEYFAQFIKKYEFRQYIKPGITGWAQVNGLRGGTPTLEHMLIRIDHDVWYATHASILLDVKILLMTLVEILRQRNAY